MIRPGNIADLNEQMRHDAEVLSIRETTNTLRVDAMVLRDQLKRYAETHVLKDVGVELRFDSLALHFRERYPLLETSEVYALTILMLSVARNESMIASVENAVESASYAEGTRDVHATQAAIRVFFESLRSA